MKRFLILVFTITLLFIAGCTSDGNKGYGYGSSQKKDIFERAAEERNTRTIKLYDTKGRLVNSCRAYKGEFDGHTWYVFYDNLAAPAVVHDPNCKCMERWK